ncbi:MAG: NfeD family protein, partial [Chloroflexota bacterium]
METFVNPNIAYLLIVSGVFLLLLTFDVKFSPFKIGAMIFCTLAGVIEFVVLRGNPWGFLIVALSPLTYSIAMRQGRAHNPLYLLTLLMLIMGSTFLFVDKNGNPLVNYGLAALVSTFGSFFLWLTIQRRPALRGKYIGETVVGMTGEVWIAIEPFSTGAVRIEGDIWRARSQESIGAGTTV